MSRLSCLPALLVFTGLLLAAAPPPGEGVLEEFRFDPEGAIIVPLTIRGKSYPFVLDTGCSVSVFDVSLRHLLGVSRGRASARTPDGVTEVQIAAPPVAFVGRQRFPGDGVVAVHGMFRRLREEHGEKVWGLLGMDFLGKHVVRIDFDRGRVALLRSAKKATGHRLPLWVATRRRPDVQVRIGRREEPQWFGIDTGMVGQGSGSLSVRSYRSLQRSGELKPSRQVFTLTLSGDGKRSIGRLERLTIGPFTHTSLYFDDKEEGDDMLGLGFWSRYRVTFDFPGQAVYLLKGARHAAADGVDGSGLAILLRLGRATVEAVAERSPAAKAGIRKGDEVVSIAGRTAAGANLVRLRRLLYGEGRTVRILVRRGEQSREVKLRLDLAWRVEGPDR